MTNALEQIVQILERYEKRIEKIGDQLRILEERRILKKNIEESAKYEILFGQNPPCCLYGNKIQGL